MDVEKVILFLIVVVIMVSNSWSETGDRYLFKLFRADLFHQLYADDGDDGGDDDDDDDGDN